MTPVIKSSAPPQKLKAGAARTEQDRADYANGQRQFEFNRGIYGHAKVKDALRDAQHDKCCFCEGRFNAYAPGDVEHYRPKGAVKQDRSSVALTPGYFWLAYSWHNLYYSCLICNRSNKRDLFPLANPGQRVRSPEGDINDEDPLILDPGGQEDLRSHIRFQHDRAVGLTEAGRTTIQSLDLNRSQLLEERLKHLKRLDTLCNLIRLSRESTTPEDIDTCRQAHRELVAAILPASAFSAMADDYLRGRRIV